MIKSSSADLLVFGFGISMMLGIPLVQKGFILDRENGDDICAVVYEFDHQHQG